MKIKDQFMEAIYSDFESRMASVDDDPCENEFTKMADLVWEALTRPKYDKDMPLPF